jgi:hypothetical protein
MQRRPSPQRTQRKTFNAENAENAEVFRGTATAMRHLNREVS